ncbi:hypothetical protein AHAS_Ahas11G0053500 [Arachis hypogaea]
MNLSDSYNSIVEPLVRATESVNFGNNSSREMIPQYSHISSSYGQEAMEAECLHQFGVTPMTSDCRGCYIKMTWIRNVKDILYLSDRAAMKKYVKCHILLLFESILFADKFGLVVHWKFLPLLRNFSQIHEISWGSASLTPFVQSISLWLLVTRKKDDHRWRNWEHFLWEAYGIDRIEPDAIPEDIRCHSHLWSAMVPFILFETLEWHATDGCRRQFGFVQSVPHQERSLDSQHGEKIKMAMLSRINHTIQSPSHHYNRKDPCIHHHYRSNLSNLPIHMFFKPISHPLLHRRINCINKIGVCRTLKPETKHHSANCLDSWRQKRVNHNRVT